MTPAASLAAALENLTADQARQRDFINEYCNNLRTEMMAKVKLMPPEWDGHEIRQLLYDKAARCTTSSMRDRRGQRYRAYEAHCLTYNMI